MYNGSIVKFNMVEIMKPILTSSIDSRIDLFLESKCVLPLEPILIFPLNVLLRIMTNIN